MNKTIKNGLFTLASFALIFPAASFAATTPVTTNSAKSEAVKICRVAYTDSVKAANLKYANAVKAANAQYKTAVADAKKLTDKTAEKTALATALKTRTSEKKSGLAELKATKKLATETRTSCLKTASTVK
jgi:DNA-binding transcriptional regulator WhiA